MFAHFPILLLFPSLYLSLFLPSPFPLFSSHPPSFPPFSSFSLFLSASSFRFIREANNLSPSPSLSLFLSSPFPFPPPFPLLLCNFVSANFGLGFGEKEFHGGA